MKTFSELYGAAPAACASAPGRVNLLGEHTDYNDGYVLPTALPMRIHVAIGFGAAGDFRVYSATLERSARFSLETPPTEHFAKYLYGCVRELAAAGHSVPALDFHIVSDVPVGAGLSSSAALEVATLRAIRELLGLAIDDVDIARLAQNAERHHAGVNCGIMDQMAASLALPGVMLFLDTRTLERSLLELPEGAEIAVIDSGVKRSLSHSGYNERRAECEAAARQLKVPALRDIDDLDAVDALPPPLDRRARHVISENRRVLAAAQGVGAAEFGAHMNASHDSLRDDFEVSIPALDDLVNILRSFDTVYGARLTGAGFGGACVALCRSGSAEGVARDAAERYRATGRAGTVLVPTAR